MSSAALIKTVVIAPANVTEFELRNASSIAALVPTTEVVICEIPEKKLPVPAGPRGGLDYERPRIIFRQ